MVEVQNNKKESQKNKKQKTTNNKLQIVKKINNNIKIKK